MTCVHRLSLPDTHLSVTMYYTYVCTVGIKKSFKKNFVIVIRIVLRSDYQAYCEKITLRIALRITDHSGLRNFLLPTSHAH